MIKYCERRLFVVGLLSTGLGCLVGGCADRDSSAASTSQQPVGVAVPAGRVDFNEVYGEWTRMLGELRDLELAFHTAPARKRESLAKQYFEKLAQGYSLESDLLLTATRAFVADPHQNEDLKEFLSQISSLLVHAECYEDALRVSQMLTENDVEDDRLYQNTADAAFACSEFELAKECMRIVGKAKDASEQNSQRLQLIDQYEIEWEREQKLREAEQAAGDLPRVVLLTFRGEIELELFENEAPNTVANFIAMVEDGFYDGLAFHEVTSRFAARAGCPLEDGSGSPGHFIRHEFDSPDRRIHFRGSLTTVSEGRVANGSQFYLTFLPTPRLEGQSTVFGRVVRGMDVLAKLQRRGAGVMSAMVSPDRIITARVLDNAVILINQIGFPTQQRRNVKRMRSSCERCCHVSDSLREARHVRGHPMWPVVAGTSGRGHTRTREKSSQNQA